MTTFLLVRHAQTEHTGLSLSGRAPGIPLSAAGRREARELSRWLSGIKLGAVLTSPLQRTRETAEIIAGRHGVSVQCRPAFIEVEYGAWTGRSIAELREDLHFQQFNSSRGTVSPPDGESALHVQKRVTSELTILTAEFVGRTVAIVTHAEVIRLAVAYYAAIPLDFSLRLSVDPASITTISLGNDTARIDSMNQRPVPVLG